MQGAQGIDLHDGEVVAKEDKRGNEDDVFGLVPQMRQQLQSTRRRQPNEIGAENVPVKGLRRGHRMDKRCLPPWQMVSTLFDRDSTLVHEICNQTRADQKGKGVENFVHL